MERTYKWVIKSAKVNSPELTRLLDANWEPFAVMTNTIGEPSIVFLRRHLESVGQWVTLALKKEQVSPLAVSLREYEKLVRNGQTHWEKEFADNFIKPLAEEIEELISIKQVNTVKMASV